MINIVCLDISQIDEDGYGRLFAQASPERQRRADRYPRREDKIRCVAADALIRYAVEQALNISEFTVVQDALGKPCVQGKEDFHFNLSHSGRWVVIAYGDSPVGIDVQQMQPDVQKDGIARRWFTVDEQNDLFDAHGDNRTRRFFQIWTAKESYLKYLGVGLRRSLDSFSVVPDGSHLGVRLNSLFLDDHCMTTCTQDENTTIKHLRVQELIK